MRDVIVLDGPAGSGKSTVSKRLAEALGFRYLDTGSMYRAATRAVLDAGVDPSDADAVAETVLGADLQVGTDPGAPTVSVSGRDVTGEIRGPDVTHAVSLVSAVPQVREHLVAQQRLIMSRGQVVAEGRDLGTTVAPDATLKVYLTASPEARARRRAAEHTDDLTDEEVAVHAESIARRDHLDSTRASSPMRAASDAVEVDTSDMTIDEVIAHISALLQEKRRAG